MNWKLALRWEAITLNKPGAFSEIRLKHPPQKRPVDLQLSRDSGTHRISEAAYFGFASLLVDRTKEW